ncbi:MAG: hypothetical protein SGI83_06755 [Bacteroidota bacterium]|nr:hypothetical protein [Bacteroidota bacterium]
MKNLLVAILAIVYITTSTGVIVHVHYCIGDISDWGIGGKNNNSCSKCGMIKIDDKGKGSCEDKVKLIKNNADQKNAKSVIQMGNLIAVEMQASYIKIPPINFSFVIEENPISHSPPRSVGVAVYIRNCVFLI